MDVKVYSNPNCTQCEQTKRWLTANNIPFTASMISDSPEVDAIIKENNFTSAPVVIAGNQVWSGFRLEKLKSLRSLDLHH